MYAKTIFAVAAIATLVGLPCQAHDSALDAQHVVARMLRAMGGAEAPHQVESIAFTFQVEADGQMRGSRRHKWYPACGHHQLNYQADGATIDVYWDLNSRIGTAAKDGVELEGTALEEALDAAHRMWVNDTYWLLMPYKLLDPGVNLEYAEAVTDGDKTYDRIKVTFDQVGLTPGDTYWAWIARDSGLMERWSFVLEGRDAPPTVFDWQDYRFYGPLLLSERKHKVGADQIIATTKIVVE